MLFLSARFMGHDEIRAVCVLALDKAYKTDERRAVCVLVLSKAHEKMNVVLFVLLFSARS